MLREHIPQSVKEHIPERIKRRFSRTTTRQKSPPEKHILGLETWQLYPFGEELNSEFLFSESLRLVDKQTPIGSIGSCFAAEIKRYLQERGFNYVQTAKGKNAEWGSAAWDRVFNTGSLRQEFERALATFEPAERLWRLDGGRVITDPYRKSVRYSSELEAEAELEEHRRTAREALLAVDVMIVTVGLTELWYSRVDGSVFNQVPPVEVFDERRHAYRVADVEENKQNILAAWELLSAANPECTMVLTVSPVPLRATFRNENVVSANAQSKATLLAAVREVVDNTEGVYYHPSYEITTSVVAQGFDEDNRHVRREVVDEIMNVFEHNFMR